MIGAPRHTKRWQVESLHYETPTSAPYVMTQTYASKARMRKGIEREAKWSAKAGFKRFGYIVKKGRRGAYKRGPDHTPTWT